MDIFFNFQVEIYSLCQKKFKFQEDYGDYFLNGFHTVIPHWLREEICHEERTLKQETRLGGNWAHIIHSPVRSIGTQIRAIREDRESKERISRIKGRFSS